ncbi:MAG TPA: biotin transporter BioY [Acidimicrobiales bacterium]|nr:biotin transporter BioY [Acidimicrobiales bacterium]
MSLPSPHSAVAVAVAPRRRPVVLADLVPGAVVRDALLVVGAAGLVGALAQLVVRLPFTPVPVTGQTLGVVLAGCALGWRRASLALGVYLAAGLAGVPWFAGHTSGWQEANGGYLVGFVVAAALCGWLAERGTDRTVLRCVPTMIAGEVVLYATAVPWLALALHVGLGRALALGCTPFLAGDAVKMACAAGLLPATWRLVGGARR